MKISKTYKTILFGLLCIMAQSNAFAQIAGKVYYDYNGNGKKETGENGVKSVTVKAFNAAGTQIGSTATTDSLGAYSITGSGPARVEFSNLPAGTYEGPLGTQSGTAMQFITGSSTTADMGVMYPIQFCQDTARVVVPCYVNGDPLPVIQGGDPSLLAGTSDVLVSFPYGTTLIDSLAHIANGKQMGAVWGTAWQRQSGVLFTAAVTKRHVGYGSLGISGIYRVDSASTKPSPKPFIALANAPYNLDFGTDPHTNLSPVKANPNPDPTAFPTIGKLGMGGLDASDDGKTLYVSNLKDRKLYSIFIDNPIKTPLATDVKGFTLPNTGCSNDEWRPWAVKFYKGKVYVGAVCTAETSKQKSDLKAMVYEFDPIANTFNTTPKITIPLTYTKGPVTTAYPGDQNWQPWQNTFFTASQALGGGNEFIYPQAILSDIEFDVDGSMVLGFLDRTGMQMGLANHDFNGACCFSGLNGGDMLRAYPFGSDWKLESNGTSGVQVSGGGVGNNQGPGGGEFYYGDYFRYGGGYSPTGVGTPHSEISLGGLAIRPGSNQTVLAVFDPLISVLSGGVMYMSNQDGNKLQGYELYSASTPGAFGKSTGIGDVEMMCALAPIDLGNRVWNDANGNGIQDAGELGVQGVNVELYKGTTKLATATTDVNGNYSFGTSNVKGGIQQNTTYLISVKLNNAAIAGQFVSASGKGTNGALDSDGIVNATNDAVVATVTTKGAGENDFVSADFGFIGCPEITQPNGPLTACSGSSPAPLTVNTQSQVIKFVVFDTKQTGTAMYTGGTALGTVVAQGSIASYTPKTTDFVNTGATSKTFYVYAILTPTPSAAVCRPFQEIIVNTSASPQAGADQKICASATTAQLAAATGTQTWQTQFGNPSDALINAQTGAISGIFNAGTYTFLLNDKGCITPVKVVKTKDVCATMGWSVQQK